MVNNLLRNKLQSVINGFVDHLDLCLPGRHIKAWQKIFLLNEIRLNKHDTYSKQLTSVLKCTDVVRIIGDRPRFYTGT